MDQVEAFFDNFQPFWIELNRFKIITQTMRQISQGFLEIVRLVRQGGLRRIYPAQIRQSL